MKTTKKDNGYVPPIKPLLNVLKRTVRQSDTLPPCCTKDEYSFDDGKSWVSSKKYFNWQRNAIKVTDIYAIDDYIL